ncbi:MAG: hypothetical protein ACE5JJ_09515, partial [Nitrospinota bacterium]
LVLSNLKDPGHPYAQAERRVLSRLAQSPAVEEELMSLVVHIVNWPRLRREMLRGGLLAEGEEGLIPTALGRWLIGGKDLG